MCLQFLTLPMIKKTKTTKLELEERKAYLVERKKIIERIGALQEEYKLWKDQTERLDAALPEKAEIQDILLQFQGLATDSGLVMKTFSFSENADPDFPGANFVHVANELLGNYSSLKIFLKKMEENLRIANVQTLNFSIEALGKEEGERGAELFFSSQLTTKFYYFPQKAVAGE